MPRHLVFLISSIAVCDIFLAAGADFQDVTPGGVQCSRDGPMCKDCMTLVNCKERATDFEVEFIGTCSTYAPCDESQKACVFGGTCRYKPFECSGVPDGKYPDQYSCRQHHICQAGQNTELSCPFPSAYNPKTNECDLSLTDSQCTAGPIGVCKADSQILTMSDLFVYTCTLENQPYKTLYPKLDTTSQCRAHQNIPDVNDCEAYYYCSETADGKYELIHRHCRPGAHYDQTQEHCVLGPCP